MYEFLALNKGTEPRRSKVPYPLGNAKGLVDGMTTERATISCDSCERLWTLGCALSVYEQQSLESRPCPHCGAYTLSVQLPREPAIAGASSGWHACAL